MEINFIPPLLPAAIFAFGLCVGSFLNVVILRLGKESIMAGRSYCPQCRHQLSWQDLIPFLSFLFLLGKCRYCKNPISLQYPLVELATGLVFLALFISGFSVFTFIISCFLILIFVYDLKYFIIPDQFIYPAIAFAIIGSWKLGIGVLAPALFFLAIYLLSRGRWLGFGDVKLALLIGLFLGWPNVLVAIFSAVAFGTAVGLALIVLKKKHMKSEVPFGPFLVAGTFFALFFGNAVASWYLNLALV